MPITSAGGVTCTTKPRTRKARQVAGLAELQPGSDGALMATVGKTTQLKRDGAKRQSSRQFLKPSAVLAALLSARAVLQHVVHGSHGVMHLYQRNRRAFWAEDVD